MKKTIRDVEVKNKRVLVRVDFNVPIENGRILDDTRIHASLPTIQYLIDQGARIILMTHLGRPDGFVVDELRTDPVAARLADLLRLPVKKVNNCIGPEVHSAVQSLQPGEVLFLENVRFHPGETVNDTRFAARLAAFADLYVNDAFASAHRMNASTFEVARYLPAVAGLLMENELNGLRQVRASIRRPVTNLLGGSRMVDKTLFIDNQLRDEKQVLLGGVLANTFLRAKGYETGQSKVEFEALRIARSLLHEYDRQIILPVDVVVADQLSITARTRIVPASRIHPTTTIVDIGPETIERYAHLIEKTGTLVWNGPLGITEIEPFAVGTNTLGRMIAAQEGIYRVACGGDTIAALDMAGITSKFHYISTGGAAFLDAIDDAALPATRLLAEKEELYTADSPEDPRTTSIIY